MAEFQYTARTDAGQRINGVIEAENEAAVLRALDEKNLFPVSVVGRDGKDTSAPIQRKPVRTRDVGMMYGQLADLIGSGVPLLRSMDSLIRSTVNRNLVELLREMRKSL